MFFVYILLCSDLSFYVGITDSLKRRLNAHNRGYGSAYLKDKLPVKLVYYEEHRTKEAAMSREKQLKGWNRQKFFQ